MSFQDVLDTFFLTEDQDAFARSQGWEDAAQMVYYENIATQGESEQLPPPPAEILLHELATVDAREVYTDSEDCPPDDLRDWSGVY
jgi:hypothetical protein